MDRTIRDARDMSNLGRRAFLAGMAAGPIALASRGLPSRAEDAANPGLIVLKKEPPNLESPFSALDGFLTPNERFYVRSHFPIPEIAAKDWTLSVGGAVDRPFRIGYDELRKLEARTAPTTLECAGNGRSFLVPTEKGTPWGNGAVGNAEWTGVPLSALLERAGVRADAVEVVLEGADQGELKDDPRSPGVIHFARGLPLSKARAPEVLLAYKMNGEDLPPLHGFPVRAVVPGWYGMASVKWLTRLIVVDQPFQGFFQSLEYTHWARTDGLPTLIPVGELQPKAQIASPSVNGVIPADKPFRIHGAAWAGESAVARVEVSTDGGETWDGADLLGKQSPHAWRLWEFHWKAPRPGPAALMARAFDAKGRAQPLERDRDRRNYMINHVLPVKVRVN